MTIDILLFYFFASFAIVSSLMVITLSNAVHSVLFLIIVFCNVSAMLLLLGVEFFSFIFLIIYVGAIAVLFLFVVMMLNIKKSSVRINSISIVPVGFLVFFILVTQVLNLLDNHFILLNSYTIPYTPWVEENKYLSNIEIIGVCLYTKFSLLFLLCGLILLVSMIGAIVLTMHQRTKVKKQSISTQLLRDPKKVIKFIELRK